MNTYGQREPIRVFCSVCEWAGTFDDLKTNNCPNCGNFIDPGRFVFLSLTEEAGYLQGGAVIIGEDESFGGSLDFTTVKRLQSGL